jgi:hypothetical protein
MNKQPISTDPISLRINELVCKGWSQRKIAKSVGLSVTAVRYRLYKIKEHTGLKLPIGSKNDYNCIICQKPLSGLQTKFCSTNCKSKYHQSNTYECQLRRAEYRKSFLIEQKGGCCQKCGYNKSPCALCFHHRDPQLKRIPLDSRSLSNTKWSLILEEAEKCDLLCLNCHAELHYN